MFFDYSTGSFYCEECYKGGGREILKETFDTLKSVAEDNVVSSEKAIKGLMLIDYYLENRADVTLEPLKEVIKICSK